MSNSNAPLLSAAEVAERLAVEVSTVRRRARTGAWPHLLVGSTPRFDWDELYAHLHRPAVAQPSAAPRQRVPAEPRTRRVASSSGVRRDRGALRSELFGS